MFLFTRYYNISATVSSSIKDLDEPYLLLTNHFGRYDPFILSYFMNKPPNFISSDAILRDKIIGTLFKGLGAVPKKKGVRDSHVIREMVKITQNGGALALFPEGTRTWTGSTSFIDPSIVKLTKLLDVPVVTAKMKGAYAFDPRWARYLRRAKVEISYEMPFAKQPLMELTNDYIYSVLMTQLEHDDIAYQQQQKIIIRSSHRAEFIDRVLFQCPTCEQFAGFTAKNNHFTCRNCDQSNFVNQFGFFTGKNDEKIEFDNIRDWLLWQNANFSQYVRSHYLKSDRTELFSDYDLRIQMAVDNGPMDKLGYGSLHFFIDRIEIHREDKIDSLWLNSILSIGSQFNERLELFYENKSYRFVDTKLKVSGLKWDLAVNEIWDNTGNQHKLSTYLKSTTADK